MHHKDFRKSKKGQVEYLLQNAFRIGFLIIALLAFFLMISYYINNQIDASYLQSQTLLNRILYSDTIMQQDLTTGRIYTGVIDMDKFSNPTVLDDGIDYGQYQRHVAAKLKLLNKEFNPKDQFVADVYLNKDLFVNLQTVINSGGTGKSSGTMYISQYPVTYFGFDNKYHYGTLVVEIIVPNS